MLNFNSCAPFFSTSELSSASDGYRKTKFVRSCERAEVGLKRFLVDQVSLRYDDDFSPAPGRELLPSNNNNNN